MAEVVPSAPTVQREEGREEGGEEGKGLLRKEEAARAAGLCGGSPRRRGVVVAAAVVVVAVALGLGLYYGLGAAPRYPVRTLPSGLVVDGNATVTVREEELLLRGNLVVTGTATLDVADAVLTLDLAAGPNSVKVIVNQSGRLLMRNVLIRQADRACRISNFLFQDNAVVAFTDVTRQCNWYTVDARASYTSTGGNTGVTLLQGFRGSVSIANEASVWLELYLTPGTHTLTSVPVTGDVLDSTAPSSFLASVVATNWPGATVSVVNCRAQQVDIGVSGAVKVTIVNSPKVSLGWSLGLYPGDAGYGQPLQVANLNTRLVANESWTLGPSSVRLVNSGLDRLWGSYWGYTNLAFVNCHLVDMFVMERAVINITDSQLDQLGVSASGSATVTRVTLARPQAGVVAVSDSGRLTVVASPQIAPSIVSVSGQGQVTYL